METAAGDPLPALLWPLGAWLLGGLLTLPLERLVRPQGANARPRPYATWMIQAGLWTLAFSALLLLSQRPVFSACLALAGALLVVLVNNAKYQALREPFLFSDFGLFSQALRHPRLYLPFLGLGKAAAGILAVGLSLYLGLELEPALAQRLGGAPFLAVAAGGLAGGALLLWRGGRAAPPPGLDPQRDLHRLGLAASLWLYWRLERLPTPVPRAPVRSNDRERGAARRSTGARARPHIIAVQSESWFDARRLLPTIRPEVFAHFDRIRAAAALHGRLQVPAWGANTMRTEFAFLSGLSPADLGVHRFNPYRRFARRPVPSLASRLKPLGYRTLCLHPHPASFFARDRVFPNLGFHEFVDIGGFDRAETCGPYICDAAVTRKLAELLESADRPLFVFAITMENHGPLHLEQVAPGDEQRLYTRPPPAGFDDLTVYLRHLENADRMLRDLTDILSQRQDGLLCWFGDHVPSMPSVYAAQGFEDGRTDYLLWRPDHATPQRRDLAVEALGAALLGVAGLGEPG